MSRNNEMQSDKVNIVASVQCHHRQQDVFCMQQKDSPRDENRFVFMWHLHLAADRF